MPGADAYVRMEDAPRLPPPPSTTGLIGWLRANLFNGWFNSLLTVVFAWLLFSYAWGIFDWLILRAVWSGTGREACLSPDSGFCWPMVFAKFPTWVYGTYPIAERWRVTLAMVLGAVLLIPMLIPPLPYKRLNAALLLGAYPLVALILLGGGHVGFSTSTYLAVAGLIALGAVLVPTMAHGLADGMAESRIPMVLAGLGLLAWLATFVAAGPILSFGSFAVSLAGLASLALLLVAGLLSLLHALAQNDAASQAALRAWLFGSLSLTAIIALLNLNFGLEPVETQKWGGLMVTLVVSVTGIAASLPIGILLALGRRSKMPIVRLFSVLFIELWRGVPLITVLFMSSVMLPLFLPPGTSFDKLLRALIGVGLFSAAYMAEVVRSGLQAIPRGQYEGANALGLSYWQTMRMIILPQALKVSIPNIVGNFISLFKDTTLVSIIGLFDLLGIVRFSLTDANWASPASAPTGYFSLAMIFWVFCFGMSRYSIFMERRLQAGQKR